MLAFIRGNACGSGNLHAITKKIGQKCAFSVKIYGKLSVTCDLHFTVYISFSEEDDFQDFINLKGEQLPHSPSPSSLYPSPPSPSSLPPPQAVLISLEKKMDELDLTSSPKGVVKPGE